MTWTLEGQRERERHRKSQEQLRNVLQTSTEFLLLFEIVFHELIPYWYYFRNSFKNEYQIGITFRDIAGSPWAAPEESLACPRASP